MDAQMMPPFSITHMPKQRGVYLIIYDDSFNTYNGARFDEIFNVPYYLRSAFLDVVDATTDIPIYVVWSRRPHPLYQGNYMDSYTCHYGLNGVADINPEEMLDHIANGQQDVRIPTLSASTRYIQTEVTAQVKAEVLNFIRGQ